MSSIPDGVPHTSISASNGMYNVTDSSGKSMQVDLGTLMMMINLETTKNLDEQIALKLDEMQARNDLISAYTELMSVCRSMKAQGLDDGVGDKTEGGYEDQGGKPAEVTIDGVTKNLCGPGSWCEELGLSDQWVDVENTLDNAAGTKKNDKGETTAWDSDKKAEWESAWDANIELISSKIDLLNNDSQMDNIELQNLLDKRNNAFEMATQVMQTNNESVESTIRNL